MSDRDPQPADLAALLLPAIRWSAQHGFDHERPAIDRALALGVGGFIVFGGPADAVRRLTRELHARSRLPLLVGADLERGAGQQFPGLTGLPPLAALGSLGDREAAHRAGRLTAREARSVGVNWVYGPVCDLDVEPENPIVGTRALGADPAAVAELAAAWIDGCQAEGVLACAKHFPGHGRTTGDSHAMLPEVGASADTLYGEDLAPFRAAIDAGVASVMSAHVAYPALDPSGAPATLSAPILTALLRGQLGFDGLVVTDALIMEGVRADGDAAAAVRALAAGCDLLLYPQELPALHRALSQAMRDGALDAERVRAALRRRERWAAWAAPAAAGEDGPPSEDPWGAEVAALVVREIAGHARPLAARTEVVVVDDDLGGPYPPPSREPLLAALREGGVEASAVPAPSGASRGPVVVALFGDIRSWKGRPGYSAASLDAVRAACRAARDQARDATVVSFSHPRLAAGVAALPELDAAVVCAWGGERPMQRAAARWLLARR